MTSCEHPRPVNVTAMDSTRVLMMCTDCGHTYEQPPADHVIRSYFERNPDQFFFFLTRAMRSDPHWFERQKAKAERIHGRPAGL